MKRFKVKSTYTVKVKKLDIEAFEDNYTMCELREMFILDILRLNEMQYEFLVSVQDDSLDFSNVRFYTKRDLIKSVCKLLKNATTKRIISTLE